MWKCSSFLDTGLDLGVLCFFISYGTLIKNYKRTECICGSVLYISMLTGNSHLIFPFSTLTESKVFRAYVDTLQRRTEMHKI